MRTSRPMKRPPMPLLDKSSSKHTGKSERKSKGKGKARQQDSTTTGTPANTSSNNKSNGIYTYDDAAHKGRGMKRAEQRLRGAKQDVSQSLAAGTSQSAKSKGKRRARDDRNANDDEDEDDSDNDNENDAFGAEGMQDYRNIKFKIGMDSDDENGDQAGFGDDDEELDSDMADTDGDEESDEDDNPASSGNTRKTSKRSQKRKVASDFYSNSEDEDDDGDSINLDEDEEDDDNDSDGGDGFIDLSEVLAKRVQKEKEAEARVLGKAITASTDSKNARHEASNVDEDDLRSFKPGSLASKKASLVQSQSGSDEDEEDDGEDEDEEDEEEDSDFDSEEDEEGQDEDDDDALGKLGSVIAKLSGKRTAEGRDGVQSQELDEREILKKRRRLMQASERNEAMPEGEFSAGPSSGANGKLTIDSLLSTLGNEQASALRQSLKPLIAANRRGDTTVEDASNAIEAELYRLNADEKALLTRERKKERSNPLKAPGAIPAPLAPLHQAKIERQAAREKQADKILEWNETVKYMKGVNREGEDDPESRLDLKALNDSQGKGKGITSAELVAKFTPANDMERQMQDILASTGATQRDLLTTESTALMEALPTKSTEAAEAQDRARIAQLRLARELMFRAERKAKRVAKIKSRTFRKIAKKSRQRQALKDGDASLTLDEMMELDAFDGGSRAEAERERLETLRARERATLRHASGASTAAAGGRWSKGIKGMDGMDDDMKDAIKTRESKQELLRRKILGQDSDVGSDESDASSGDDADDGADDGDIEDLKTSALDTMERIQGNGTGSQGLSKGVMGMKFMQRAAKRDHDRVDGMIEDFRMQVEGDSDGEEIVGSSVEKEKAAKGGDLMQENPGRMIFGPSAISAQNSNSQPDANVQGLSQRAKKRLNSVKTVGNISVTGAKGSDRDGAQSPGMQTASSTATLLDYNPFTALTTGKAHKSAAAPIKETNPWLSGNPDESKVRLSSKKNNQTVGKDSGSIDKAASKLQKTQSRSKEALQKAQTDATVDVDVEHVLSNNSKLSTPRHLATSSTSSPAIATSPVDEGERKLRENAPPPSSAQANRATANGKLSSDSDDSDNDSDVLPEAVRQNQGPTAFKQRDLVARAFAGDNVVTDFIEMKKAEIEADAPKDEDMTLPGWGAWGGKGARKSQKQQQKKKIKHIPGIEASDRKDAKYDHVIISEKTDRKAAKYMTKDLPYPYTSVRQFEQKMAQPTGAEWNTRGSVKEVTTPRVLTKPGMVIKPVTRKV